jgi:sugar lactone lactonase YvrE
VMRPDGTAIKDIAIGSATTNCTFGGDDGQTLYITAWATLWKVEGMPIPGLDWVVNTKRLKCD